jgi:hypothetical protein
MKWMKVIYTRENLMNQEFQHCSESQLIEVMNSDGGRGALPFTVLPIPARWREFAI